MTFDATMKKKLATIVVVGLLVLLALYWIVSAFLIKGRFNCKEAGEAFQVCRSITTDNGPYAPIPGQAEIDQCRTFYLTLLPQVSSENSQKSCDVGTQSEIDAVHSAFNVRMKRLKERPLPELRNAAAP